MSDFTNNNYTERYIEHEFSEHAAQTGYYTPNFREFKSGWDRGCEWIISEMYKQGDISKDKMIEYTKYAKLMS